MVLYAKFEHSKYNGVAVYREQTRTTLIVNHLYYIDGCDHCSLHIAAFRERELASKNVFSSRENKKKRFVVFLGTPNRIRD